MHQSDPVDIDEFVYRRIHRTFFDVTAPISVQFPAFRPTSNDTAGLSLFRAIFVSPADTLAQIDPVKAGEYYIGRLSVRALYGLGLSVAPDPLLTGPLGHATIPELNWQDYIANKQKWKTVLVELAKLASGDIVLRAS